MEDIIIKSSLGAVGVLFMFLLTRLWIRQDKVERQASEMKSNYIDRFAEIIKLITASNEMNAAQHAELRTLILEKFSATDKTIALHEFRIESIEKPKRRRAS
jgi:hypothetical protein